MGKVCDWCEKTMLLTNFKRHQNSCVFKNEIQLKRSDIDFLKKQRPREKDEVEEVTLLELKHFLTESFNKTMNLYQRIVVEKSRDPLEKIKEMRVSEPTRENYIIEWRLFTKWLKKNHKAISVDSANTYIASLKGRPSTQRKKHNMLQLLLQHLIDRNLHLNRFSMRISYKPKRALTNEELFDYMQEQKEISLEDYIIQRLLITYGLRINTIALLKVIDLEFLDIDSEKEEHFIHLPDSKVKNRRLEPIDKELELVLTEFVGKDMDKDEFIFYKEGKGKNMRRRAQDLGVRINNKIKESKILKKRGNYQYTSHMFRKTKAYNMFQKEVDELKDKVRASIGQSQGSMAIEHYIN